MKTEVSLEQIIFFAVAKAVRNEQDTRKFVMEEVSEFEDNRGYFEKYKRTSLYIHVPENRVWSIAHDMAFNMKYPLTYQQFWAVFYKLQEKELVKIHKGNSKRTTKVGLWHKGVQYVQSIKAEKVI